MYIFIDESGTFIPEISKNSVSCVAALVIPETFIFRLFRKFRKLTNPWKNDSKEIKGKNLNEEQIDAVVNLEKKFDSLLICSCVDLKMQTEEYVTQHKTAQADFILKAITVKTSPKLKREMEDLSMRTRALSNQLYIQSVVLSTVIDRVIRDSTLYYSQRQPKTLGRFRFIIDAKDRSKITEYESLWKEIVAPFLQTKSLREPMAQLTEGDYSAFNKFCGQKEAAPDYLKRHIKNPSKTFLYFDIGSVLIKNIKFHDSSKYTGLQIIDVLTNCVRRACNKTLQKDGWKNIGRLMVCN
ncbi:MAG: DUF3800 domain-containing protein [Xanthomonadaceae bacterium]|nr:DUF3800 domain-containing protein [Xanthomonadaceae bacterium]